MYVTRARCSDQKPSRHVGAAAGQDLVIDSNRLELVESGEQRSLFPPDVLVIRHQRVTRPRSENSSGRRDAVCLRFQTDLYGPLDESESGPEETGKTITDK